MDRPCCPDCEGLGKIVESGFLGPLVIVCLRCNGTGRVPAPEPPVEGSDVAALPREALEFMRDRDSRLFGA